MKWNLNIQGVNLHSDHVKVVRAILADAIVGDTRQITGVSALNDVFFNERRRFVVLLEAIDGADYLPLVDTLSPALTVFINGQIVDEDDTVALCSLLSRKANFLSSIREIELEITGFSRAHYMHLLEKVVEPLIGKIPKDPEEDEPIPD